MLKTNGSATILAAVGTLLALFVAVFKREGDDAGGLLFVLFFVVGPWLVLDVLYVALRWARSIAIAAGLMLALEVYMYVGVFVVPHGSTDALAYVIKPGIQLLVLLPLGMVIGRIFDKTRNKGGD